jgi:carboxylesterase type B
MRNNAAAKRILDSLPLLAARFDVNAVTGAAPGSAGVFALAAIPARYALERRAWSEAAALRPVSSSFPWTESMVYFARALGASHGRAPRVAQPSIDSLASIRDRFRAARAGYWAEQVEIQRLGATAWLHLARARRDSALFYMREAVRREDATDKNAVTPGPLAPARELLGDMLMQLAQPSDALVEYRATLEKEPNRYRTLDGARRAAAASGDRAAESRYAAALRRLTSR